MQSYQYMLNYVLTHGSETPNRTGTSALSIFGYQWRHDLSKGFPLLTTKKIYTRSVIHELLWFLMGADNIEYLADNDVHIWDAWATKENEVTEKRRYFEQVLTDLMDVLRKDLNWIDVGTSDAYKYITKKIGNNVGDEEWMRYVHDNYNIPLVEQKITKERGHVGPIYGYQWRNWNGKKIDQIKDVIKSLIEDPYSRRHIVSAWNVEDVPDMALPPCHTFFQFNVRRENDETKLDCQMYMRKH